METRAPNRAARRKARTAKTILAAAEAVYAERGFGEATIEEIAERADVAVGSIYNHFGSKRGLELAVAERAAEADERFMNQAYGSSSDATDQIRAAGGEFLRFYREHPDYFRLLAFPQPAADPASEPIQERIAARVDAQNARLVEALQRGIEDGSVRAVDTERVATVLWSAWSGIIALAWRPDSIAVDANELERLIDAAADLVAHGLATRGPDTGRHSPR